MDTEKTKIQIKRIYDAAFPADPKWNDWFFEHVYRPDEAMLLAPGGNPVSCLFLQSYRFLFHGHEVGLGYISGAATATSARRNGYMADLLTDALHQSYDRGDVFAALIPATRRLYNYYDRFGFATVVYADIERYTSVHTFDMTEGYTVVEPGYDALHALELQRSATVLHSPRDYGNILADIAHDGGVVTVVNDPDGNPAAMAFATADANEIHVKELLGIDPAARDMALGAVKFGMDNAQKPMAVWCGPSGRRAMLRARGMMRIVNVGRALSTLAGANPRVDQVIRVTDRCIPQNNGTYIVHDGDCRQVDTTMRHLTLDVTTDVLTRILFSSSRIGQIFNLPTIHPMLPLMLD